ncbi:MAG: hypothetical protein NT159_06315 [Proteobacteria bacterium]|nr:hypothetical protein [Pseudomonadota bacterium]
MNFHIATFIWSALLLVLRWRLTLPNESADFLRAPLLNLPTGLALAWLGALAACLTDIFLRRAIPKHLSAKTDLPALAAASLATMLLPFHPASGLLFGGVLLAGRALSALFLQPYAERGSMLASAAGIRGIFFVSGMAALIYQVTWQRKLISLLGADGQSVTLIVAVFLGGLGCGALLGEKFASRISGRQGIILFCVIEAAIGVFGVFSLSWLEWIGTRAEVSLSPPQLLAAAATALALPTILMGMTLPLLVETLKEKVPTLHENVGRLYALNALGSAAAALFSATVLFPFTGLQGATWLAATLNGLTAVLVLQASAGWPKNPLPSGSTPAANSGDRIAWPLAAMLAMATGFVSISQEILLLRMMSWSTAGRPWVFGLGVGAFLFGMGLGSLRITRIDKKMLMHELSWMWAVTTLAVLLLPALSAVVGGLTTSFAGAPLLAATLGVLGFFGGSSLPLLAGAVRPDRSGRSHFGVLYAANIVGAVAGSGITGYILLDHFTTAECVSLSAIACLLMALAFTGLAHSRASLTKSAPPMIAAILILAVAGPVYSHWREWLYDGGLTGPAFLTTVETRAGIIAVKSDPPADTVIGGGAYDGRFNVDPKADYNLVSRVYLTMALHPQPARVLQIGLSSGSWTKAILSFPSVRELLVVEINPGYEKLVRATPLVAGIFDDPRLLHAFTDGRKWLRAHEERWDAIVINTSFYWREGSTMLHSREFMELARSRLNPGGTLFINTTGAAAIPATALSVFPGVYRISNGIAAINGHLPDTSIRILASRLSESNEFSARFPTTIEAEIWVRAHMPELLDRKRYLDCHALTDDAMALEWGKAYCEPRI